MSESQLVRSELLSSDTFCVRDAATGYALKPLA